MKYILTLVCFVLSLNSGSAYAAKDPSGVSEVDKLNVAAALEKISTQVGKKLTAADVRPSPIPGLLEVTVDTNVLYVYGGNFVISGEILDLSKDKKNWSITEQTSRRIRAKLLAALDPKDMIIYAAKKPQIGSVLVFTDIDCTYCHKLQDNIQEYTDLGIELRYVAFPRTGPDTPSYYKAVSVWCSSDPKRDLTLSMHGTDLPKNKCARNPVDKEFELGLKIGVNGTPTLVLENGSKIAGLASPEELAKLIKEQSK